MKKLVTTILGLSLFAGVAISANDTFKSFYPVENEDTPEYILNKVVLEGSMFNKLAKSSIKKETYNSLFPKEDIDTPDYLSDFNTSDGNLKVSYKVHSSSMLESCQASNAFYPEENNDSPSLIC